jgi:hypothetical protein
MAGATTQPEIGFEDHPLGEKTKKKRNLLPTQRKVLQRRHRSVALG